MKRHVSTSVEKLRQPGPGNIAGRIRTHVKKAKGGTVFSVSSLGAHYGSPRNVSKAFSRLHAAGEVERLQKGLYCKPINSQFFGRVLPSVEELVEPVTRHRGHRIEVHGAEAARHFRLSTQQPMRPIYHTTGPTETLQIGGQPVEFVHLSARFLKHAGTPTGKAIVALKYVGREDLTPEIAGKVMEQLEPQYRQRLAACAQELPAWMCKRITEASKNLHSG